MHETDYPTPPPPHPQTYGKHELSAQMLKVSLLGVGTALRLERNGGVVNGHTTEAALFPPLRRKQKVPKTIAIDNGCVRAGPKQASAVTHKYVPAQ